MTSEQTRPRTQATPPPKRGRGRPRGVVLDGDRIRAARLAVGWSQDELAMAADLSVRTVGAAERGGRIAADTAVGIAVTLGVPYIELLGTDPHALRASLVASGYAALAPSEPWVDHPEEARVAASCAAEGGALVCVEGPGGIGKSALARRVAAAVDEAFPGGVLWLNAASLTSPDRVRRVQLDVARCLGFADDLPDPSLVAVEAFDRGFARRLWSARRLVVVDDVVDPDLVERLRDPEQPSWILATTAHRLVAESLGAERIALAPWDDERVVALLGAVLGTARLDADVDGTRRLAAAVGGSPLGARAAGERLKRHPYETPGDYAARVPPGQGRVEDALPPDRLAAFRALSVFQDQPFSLPFASAATGLSDRGTRAVLHDLTDLYLVRQTDDASSEPRFQLEAGAREVSWWRSPEVDAAAHRLLLAAPGLAKAATGERTGKAAAERLQRDLPAWRLLLDEATRRLVGGDALPASTAPEALPTVEGPADVRRALVETLAEMSVLLMYHQPPHTGSWVTVGLAAARAEGDARAVAALSTTMMLWWTSSAHDYVVAARWAREVARLARTVPSVDRALSMLGFASAALRVAEGRDPANALLEEAVVLARSPEASVPSRVAALCSLGASTLTDPAGAPAWARGRALLEEAYAAGDGGSDEGRHIRHKVVTNLAALRFLLGEAPSPPEDVRAATRDFLFQYADYDLLCAQCVALAALLGAPVAWSPPRFGDAMLAVPPALVGHLLHKLEESVVDLGVRIPGVAYEGAVDTPAGAMSLATLALGAWKGAHWVTVCLILPVAPLRSALSGDGLRNAIRFVEAAAGPGNRVAVALRELQAREDGRERR